MNAELILMMIGTMMMITMTEKIAAAIGTILMMMAMIATIAIMITTIVTGITGISKMNGIMMIPVMTITTAGRSAVKVLSRQKKVCAGNGLRTKDWKQQSRSLIRIISRASR